MNVIYTILNPFWRLATTVTVYSLWDKAVVERAWKNDYEPFGYVMKRPIYEKGNYYVLKVCKDLKSKQK